MAAGLDYELYLAKREGRSYVPIQAVLEQLDGMAGYAIGIGETNAAAARLAAKLIREVGLDGDVEV